MDRSPGYASLDGQAQPDEDSLSHLQSQKNGRRGMTGFHDDRILQDDANEEGQRLCDDLDDPTPVSFLSAAEKGQGVSRDSSVGGHYMTSLTSPTPEPEPEQVLEQVAREVAPASRVITGVGRDPMSLHSTTVTGRGHQITNVSDSLSHAYTDTV